MRLTPRVLVSLIVLLLACVPSALHAQTLMWDPNTESDLAGYIVHYGTQSGNYTTQVNVGKNTSFSPTGRMVLPWSPLYLAVRGGAPGAVTVTVLRS